MKKRIISLFTIVYLLFALCYHPIDARAAAVAPSAAELASYFLSVTGACDLVTGGGVRQVAQNVRDSLTEKCADLIGSGIYENSKGEYVFSGEATQELYETLLGSETKDGKVVSDFGGNFPMGALLYSSDQYLSALAKSTMQSAIGNSGYSSYLVGLSSCHQVTSSGQEIYYFSFRLFDLSNVAYLLFTSESSSSNSSTVYIRPYDSSGNTVYYSYKYGQFSYNVTTGYISNMTINNSSTNSYFSLDFTSSSSADYGSTNSLKDNRYYLSSDIGATSLTKESAFNAFPFYGSGGTLFWCNKSLIVAKNNLGAQNLLYQTGGIFVSNYFENIPTISTDVVTNNNWSSIYSNYVQNVSNEYGDGDGLTAEDLRNIMKRYTDNITTAINTGVSDIEDSISATNQWLKKIFDTLNDILDILESGGGSSGGGSGTESTDYSTILNQIFTLLGSIDTTESSILTDTDTLLVRLATTNTYLQQILAKLNTMGNGGGGGNNFNPTVNLPDLTTEVGLPDFDINAPWLKTQSMITGLQSVMPLCYVFILLDLVSALHAEPVAPRFEIPFKLNSASGIVNIDEKIILDFTLQQFQTIRTVWAGLWCFIFVIWLIYITFVLVGIISDMLT